MKTASGQCAQVGTTIAVDVPWLKLKRNPVIPYKGTVDIETIGTRKALDTGGKIIGYHIDVYNGVGKTACNVSWSRSYKIIDFMKY